MLQAPATCAVNVGLTASVDLPALLGSVTAIVGVSSTFWWLGAGAVKEFTVTVLHLGKVSPPAPEDGAVVDKKINGCDSI